MKSYRKELEITHARLDGWKSISDSLHSWNANRYAQEKRFEALEHELEDHKMISEKMASIQHDENAATVSRLETKIEESASKIASLETTIDDLRKGGKKSDKKISQLVTAFDTVSEDLRVLETWTITSVSIACFLFPGVITEPQHRHLSVC